MTFSAEQFDSAMPYSLHHGSITNQTHIAHRRISLAYHSNPVKGTVRQPHRLGRRICEEFSFVDISDRLKVAGCMKALTSLSARVPGVVLPPLPVIGHTQHTMSA